MKDITDFTKKNNIHKPLALKVSPDIEYEDNENIKNMRQVIKDYKIRERVIIEESLAELFSVNAAETYTEQEVLDAYNKSMKDVYSYMSSWEKNHIH